MKNSMEDPFFLHGSQKRLVIFFMLFMACMVLSPSLSLNAQQLYTTEGVNVRKKASSNSKIKGALEAGTAVTKTGKNGNWIKISSNGLKGYIYKKYLSSSKTVKENSSNNVVTKKINADEVNLRKKASGSSKVKAVLYKGDTVKILKKSGSWTKVITSKGKKGYVFSKYIGKKVSSGSNTSNSNTGNTSLSSCRSSAIAYCSSRLGDKYSQAKRDQPGFADCSSLVRDASQNACGKFIGNTTTAQKKNMKDYLYKIKSISEVSPGDLVYHFSKSNHTGIYIGEGKVIHASQTAGIVKISEFSVSSTYWEYGCNAASYCDSIE